MFREPLGHPSRRLFLAHRPRRQRVIRHHLSRAMQHVRPRRIALLVCERKTPEPIIQRWFATIEEGNIVVLGQLFDRGESLLPVARGTVRHFRDSSLGIPISENSLSSSGLIRAVLSSTSVKAFHRAGEATNSRLSAITCSACKHALSRIKSVRLTPLVSAPVRINFS